MKILVSGPVQCGKSSYIKCFDANSLNIQAKGADDKYYTVGMDLGSVSINNYKTYLFGTPGLSRFSTIREIISSGSDGIVFIFDASNPEKDEEARKILDSIYKILGNELPIIFLANKQDLEGARTPKDILKQNNLPSKIEILPTSVKNGLNIKKSLKIIFGKIVMNYKDLLGILKSYEDNIKGLAEKLKKDKIEMKDFLNKLEIRKLIEIDRLNKTFKVKNVLI
ncbi:MAG: GTP-binding protein [Candidatus Lokiarchaeota archaeon]|nr:GTP-binding protein [Candidatus Lokiarchaeota archaeon]